MSAVSKWVIAYCIIFIFLLGPTLIRGYHDVLPCKYQWLHNRECE